eukprot:gene23088-biopygen23801
MSRPDLHFDRVGGRCPRPCRCRCPPPHTGGNGSGRGPDAGRTIDFEETDADRTRTGRGCGCFSQGHWRAAAAAEGVSSHPIPLHPFPTLRPRPVPSRPPPGSVPSSRPIQSRPIPHHSTPSIIIIPSHPSPCLAARGGQRKTQLWPTGCHRLRVGGGGRPPADAPKLGCEAAAGGRVGAQGSRQGNYSLFGDVREMHERRSGSQLPFCLAAYGAKLWRDITS